MSDQTPDQTKRFVFPRWANYLLPLILIGAMGGGLYVPAVVGLGLNPNTLNKNYMPKQPIPYSHELHVGQLGLDCTYCHTSVDKAGFAAIPTVETCMTCHSAVKKNSPKLAPLYEAYESGEPVEWIKVHDIADYAYFNHQAHVTKGVSCVSCHGRVDRMGEEGVYQHENLSMGWCLDCHRAPEEHLRPPEEVTNLAWTPLDDDEVIAAIKAGTIEAGDEKAAQLLVGHRIKKEYNVHNAAYMQACSTCHR
ncbi:MAG: cytochrome c3 family protein [Planctomycetota bacterium]